MTHTTEQERALSSLRHLYQQMAGGMVKDSAQAKRIAEGLLSPAIAKLEQAARRAPAVQPDQLPPDAAKRAMEELQTEVEKLRSALAECRDACPIPKPGASNEEAWMQSIGDPESVPAFVKSCFGAPAVPAISEATVLAITTAYEQGVGKGHQSHARKEAITNPYSDEWGCDSAWQMGYDEGREQVERKAAAPQQPEAQASVSNVTLAAPVRMPDAAAICVEIYQENHLGFLRTEHLLQETRRINFEIGEKLYTELQVRELLAAGGIEVAP